MQQFNQFRQQMQGKNPQEIVQNLLQSGQMNPQQFEALKQQAQGFLQLLK